MSGDSPDERPENDVETTGTVLDPADEQDGEQVGPHLVLELEGEHAVFEAKGRQANQLLLVKYMDALGTPGFPATDAVVKLALGQVKDRARLEDYLERHGFAVDFDQALYDALAACWRGETMLPLVRSSGSAGATSET